MHSERVYMVRACLGTHVSGGQWLVADIETGQVVCMHAPSQYHDASGDAPPANGLHA